MVLSELISFVKNNLSVCDSIFPKKIYDIVLTYVLYTKLFIIANRCIETLMSSNHAADHN